MADIGALVIKIGADASELQRAFDQMGGSAKQFERSVSTMGKVAGAALASATTAIVAMTIASGRHAEELQQLSAITGVNTDKLQEYDVMMSRAGLSGEDMVKITQQLSKSMDEARRGTGTAADRFRQLGIDITKVTNSDDLLRKFSDSIARIASGSEKLAIGSDLAGKSFANAIRAFDGGSKAIEAAAEASAHLGRILSSIEIERLAKMDDAIDDLGTSWKRFTQQIGVTFEPAISLVVSLFTKMLAQGTETFHKLQLATDLFAIDLLHMAMAAEELGSVLFTEKTVKQALANIKLIFSEASKLKTLARSEFEMKVAAPDDIRAKAPALVDTAKLAAQAQAMADALQKFSEANFANEQAIADARMANYEASLNAQKTAGIQTEEEIAAGRQAAMEKMDAFIEDNLNKQIAIYAQFYQKKSALFTADEKGQAEKAKFEVESSQHMISLLNQLEVAQIKSDTNRIKSASALAEANKKQVLEPMQDQMELAKANFELQQAFYNAAPALIGAADAAREKGLELLRQESDLRATMIRQNILDESRRATLLIALDGEMQAKRMALIQQFPTFWEQQLQSMVASNAFSMGAIVNTWTSGIATMILKGGDLKAAWEATQQALLQSALNMLVQWGAQTALAYIRDEAMQETFGAAELARHKGLETAKTALTTAGEAARFVIVAGTNKAIAAATISSLATIAAIGEGAIAVMTVVMGAVAAMMFAIAAALKAGIYTAALSIPVDAAATELAASIPIIAAGATGALQAALGAAVVSASPGMVASNAEGGIILGPTLSTFAEKGPEAAIPLNSRGAAFMQRVFGNGGSEDRVIHTHVHIDGREVAQSTVRHLPRAMRTQGAPA